jgi:hypothetical protein
MASEIKVDTIVNAGGDNDTGIDLATNDQILLKVANATKLTMNSTGQTTIVGEGGTTTTSIQQGLTKCWCKFDGTASTPSFSDSFNMASITDEGTGDYTVNIANDMANDDYSCTTHGINRTFLENFDQVLVGSVRFVGRTQAGNATDINEAGVQICGDLA